MKILCSLSSVEFSCDHFPATLYSRESFHPIFNIPQKKLLPYLSKWAAGELTSTDSYLYFLALLHSSDLVEFRVPAIRTSRTDSIIALHMEPLIKTLIRLNTVRDPAAVFPRYVISPETKTLDNISFWIQNWKQAYADYKDGYVSAHESHKLQVRESALERLIKNPHKPISAYASQLADWAAIAGNFPTFSFDNPIARRKTTLAEYWKSIIYRCAQAEHIFSIIESDLRELIEHCEEHIPVGSIYSNALFKVLRHALNRQKDFLGIGDADISKSTYSFLTESDTVESANIKAMVDSAPLELPKPEQYPNKISYLRAKMRYDLALKAGTRTAPAPTPPKDVFDSNDPAPF